MPPSSIRSNLDPLLPAVQQALTTHRMLTPGDRVLVGVSGGPDSMALLHLLHRLAAELQIELGVAHLNHCLRGPWAERDAAAVACTAAAMQRPLHVRRARVMNVQQRLGLSLEEASHRVRYAFFRKTMADAGYNKLALGHHQDDNAEQMLMVLLRGAGPRGLSGIAPVRDNRIIRPLIHARRSQIEAFIAKEGIACVQDESNHDLRFMRNRIRHHLLPLLAADYNPRIGEHLNRLADILRTEETWIDGLVTDPYRKARLHRHATCITLSAGRISQAHPALARRLIRKALQELCGSLRRITFCHLQSVLNLLANDGAEKALHLPNGIRVRRSGDQLTICLFEPDRRGRAEATFQKPAPAGREIPTPFPAAVEIAAMGVELRFSLCRPRHLPPWGDVGPDRAYVDLDRLNLPLTVRPAAAGDRFTPLGAAGSQKLKKFFIDHRISRQARANAPVLTDQHGIVWLIGQRIDERVKVTAATTRALGVEFFLLDTR